jgi:hypothetical protein
MMEIEMTSLRHALSMAYDFETREANVVYPPDQAINAQELQEYFDDATDGRVRRINVTVGNSLFVTLARDDQRKWIAIEGLKDWLKGLNWMAADAQSSKGTVGRVTVRGNRGTAPFKRISNAGI